MWMLVHGFTGSPRSWDTVAKLLDFREPPLMPALLGHEANPRVPESTSFEEEVARLASMASSMGHPRLLCGYSLGARVALGMLARHPDLFDGAVLIGVHPGLEDSATRSERRATDARRARLLRAEGLASFVAAWEDLPIFRSQRDLPREVLEQQRSIRSSHDPEGLARSLEVLGLAEMPSYRAALSSLDIPVTLMAGSRDHKFRALVSDLCHANPHLESTIVDGTGHNLLLEAPEAVAAALKMAEARATARLLQ